MSSVFIFADASSWTLAFSGGTPFLMRSSFVASIMSATDSGEFASAASADTGSETADGFEAMEEINEETVPAEDGSTGNDTVCPSTCCASWLVCAGKTSANTSKPNMAIMQIERIDFNM